MSEHVWCLADKGQLEGFEFWLLIFNYNAPCGFTSVPPIRELIQVSRGLLGMLM